MAPVPPQATRAGKTRVNCADVDPQGESGSRMDDISRDHASGTVVEEGIRPWATPLDNFPERYGATLKDRAICVLLGFRHSCDDLRGDNRGSSSATSYRRYWHLEFTSPESLPQPPHWSAVDISTASSDRGRKRQWVDGGRRRTQISANLDLSTKARESLGTIGPLTKEWDIRAQSRPTSEREGELEKIGFWQRKKNRGHVTRRDCRHRIFASCYRHFRTKSPCCCFSPQGPGADTTLFWTFAVSLSTISRQGSKRARGRPNCFKISNPRRRCLKLQARRLKILAISMANPLPFPISLCGVSTLFSPTLSTTLRLFSLDSRRLAVCRSGSSDTLSSNLRLKTLKSQGACEDLTPPDLSWRPLNMSFKILRRKTSVEDCKTHVKSSRLKTFQDLKARAKASRLKTLQVLKTRAKISRLKTSVGDCSRRARRPRASRPQWKTAQDAPQDASRACQDLAPQDARQDLAPQALSGRLLKSASRPRAARRRKSASSCAPRSRALSGRLLKPHAKTSRLKTPQDLAWDFLLVFERISPCAINASKKRIPLSFISFTSKLPPRPQFILGGQPRQDHTKQGQWELPGAA
ncbi:hypothetical protein DFH08DRAFT_942462 [Mycena albidolilacea]|uniref:Uncharacterized protein n=1 Tax=Mycena albidolilacea TaxID=1033008 RepID=A0AAD7EGM5_9AGAR|nr:hypothetical protein DFH08DRAFT_942462 [Mycena albidolilacea]